MGVILSIITFSSIMIGSIIFIQFETRMAKKLADQYTSKLQNVIHDREKYEKTVLQNTMRHILDSFTAAAGDYLYNFRIDELPLLINSVLQSNDIIAICVYENASLPVIAGWKYPDRNSGKMLPQDIHYAELFKSISQNYKEEKEFVGKMILYYSEKRIEDSLKRLKDKSKKEIQAFYKTFDTQLNNLIIIQIVSVILIIFSIIAAQIYSIRKVVLNPLHSIKKINFKLSEFDLTLNIQQKNNDEFGQLIRAINTMIYRYKSVVGDVKNDGNMLSVTSKSIVNISKKLSDFSEATKSESENVANASEKMSLHIQNIFSKFNQTNENTKQISNNSEKIAQNVQLLAQALENMKESMKSTQENAIKGSDISKNAVDMAENARQSIYALEEASNEIGDVIQVIMKIADKTNLLALNAAIEAAAAGDAGKGFAVVAGAIQKFADQSSLAAENIAEKIISLQENSHKTIQVLMNIIEIVKEMNHAISVINENVSEQSVMSDTISENALKAQERGKQIADNMADLSKSTNDITSEISYIAQESEQVSKSILTVTVQTKENNHEINRLNDITDNLEKLSTELKKLVGVFKI